MNSNKVGIGKMISIKEILDIIRPFLNVMSSEPVNLQDGLGRVLGADVRSRSLIPPYNISNVDGYAINSDCMDNIPATFIKAGISRPSKIFQGVVEDRQCIKIFSGCPIPKGTNAIVSLQDVEVYESSVIVGKHIMEGENISMAGIDIAEGDIILKKGTILSSRHVALSNITDVPWLPVIRSPKIGIITNLDIDYANMEFTHIQKKNGFAIKSFLMSFIDARGGRSTNLGMALNMQAPVAQIPAFKKELREALGSVDMLVVVGGMHLAGENLLWSSLMQDGANLETFKVAIGSGEEIVIGNKNNIPIIGLPDHNVASLICALLFLRPCIDILLGIKYSYEDKVFATLDRDLDEFDISRDYLYAKLYENKQGDKIVSPISAQDTLMISVLTGTNCIIVIDKNCSKAGSAVETIMFTGSIIST